MFELTPQQVSLAACRRPASCLPGCVSWFWCVLWFRSFRIVPPSRFTAHQLLTEGTVARVYMVCVCVRDWRSTQRLTAAKNKPWFDDSHSGRMLSFFFLACKDPPHRLSRPHPGCHMTGRGHFKKSRVHLVPGSDDSRGRLSYYRRF